MNRALPILIFLAALLFFFVSEKMDFTTPQEDKHVKTVKFWAFSIPAKTMLSLKTDFEERHPDIRVEVQTIPWESLQQKTLWAIAAGSDVPDVIVGSSEWTGGLINSGGLEPLDKWFKGDEKDDFFKKFFPTTLGIYQYPEVRRDRPEWRGGRTQYGVPLDLDLMLIFYRADILDPIITKLGMNGFPQSWEGMEKLGRALRDESGGNSPTRFLLYLDPDDPVPMSMAFLPSSGGHYLSPDFSRATFNDLASRKAFEFFESLLTQKIATRWERNTMEDPIVLYKKDQALANIAGPWYAKVLESKAPEQAGKWRVALFPRREPQFPTSGLGGACLAIPHNAQNKREAVELIEYMCSDRFALSYFQRVGSPPPIISAWNDPVFKQPHPYFGGQVIYDVVNEAIQAARPIQMMPNTEVTKGPVRWALREIAVRGAAPEEVLNKAAARADAILAGH
ncbi:MAG: extracellular solute-binding protein [Candidatus Sumerlaeaceae bacterium]|nr:extracellular solute-binding protein [Candidatus Sumerlaeaceae bacterium]